MNYRDKIISDIAEAACNRLSRKVIHSLMQLNQGMQSGSDTPLKNIWDEICVQVQDQESVMWDAYSDTMESLILENVTQLDTATKRAIWLQTDGSIDWSIDHEDSEDQEVPIAYDEIAAYILKDFILPIAADWSNERIRRYLER